MSNTRRRRPVRRKKATASEVGKGIMSLGCLLMMAGIALPFFVVFIAVLFGGK